MARCGIRHPEDPERACLIPAGVHADHMDARGLWPNVEVQERVEIAQRQSVKRSRANKGHLREIAARGAKGRRETLAAERSARFTEPPGGDRDGETYEAGFDRERLNAQARRVYDRLVTGRWLTLAQIAEETGDPEASISARIRDLRKDRFGALDVERRRVGETGLFEYRIPSGQGLPAGNMSA